MSLSNESPFVSVIIPAYNEEKTLDATLTSLSQQTYHNKEIIVVDNKSTDKTRSIADKHQVQIVREERKGVAWARQRGCEVAQGEILVITDADITFPRDWIERIIKQFLQDVELVGYGGLFTLSYGPLTAKLAIRYLLYPLMLVDKFLSGGWTFWGLNMAIRKDAFHEVGGFNTSLTLGEDADIALRLKRIGKVVLNRNLLVYASGRRYKKGLLRGIWYYFPNWIMRVLFKKQTLSPFPDIR